MRHVPALPFVQFCTDGSDRSRCENELVVSSESAEPCDLAPVEAINAARLAVHGDGRHLITLDGAVATMLQTELDMSHKLKETSLGGLAVNLVEC